MSHVLFALALATPFAAAIAVILTGVKLRKRENLRALGTALIALPILIFAWFVGIFFLLDASPAWLTQSWPPVLPMILGGAVIIGLMIGAPSAGPGSALAILSIPLVLAATCVMFATLHLG